MGKSLSQNQNRHHVRHALCLCFISGAWFTGSSYIGGLPGAYLRSSAGAVSFAMGGAGSASPEYMRALLNPAMLARLKTTQFDIGGGLRSLGRTEGYSSFEYKVSPRVGMGLGAVYRGDPSLDNLYNENEDPLESGSYTALACKIGLSYLFTRKISAGLALGYYYQRMPTSYNEAKLQYSTASTIGGFDFAARAMPTQNWALAIIFQNIDILKVLSGQSASIELNWAGGDNYNIITEKIAPVAVFASQLGLKLKGYPLLWACDIHGYPVDGDFKKLERIEVRLNNGFEWKRWDVFSLRAGIGDFLLNQDIFSNSAHFWDDAAPRITLGFGADLSSKIHKKLRVNYGIATDRVWAGVDQRIDFSYSF